MVEIERSRRTKKPVSLLFIDIDKFKEVNDMFGHAVGDKKILQISEIIKSIVRETDIVCRWGGEEFAVILPESDGQAEDHAEHVAERIRIAVETICQTDEIKTIYKDKGQTVSIGIGTYIPPKTVTDHFKDPDTKTKESKKTAEELFVCADSALYHAKESGRNQVIYYDTSIPRRDRNVT